MLTSSANYRFMVTSTFCLSVVAEMVNLRSNERATKRNLHPSSQSCRHKLAHCELKCYYYIITRGMLPFINAPVSYLQEKRTGFCHNCKCSTSPSLPHSQPVIVGSLHSLVPRLSTSGPFSRPEALGEKNARHSMDTK